MKAGVEEASKSNARPREVILGIASKIRRDYTQDALAYLQSYMTNVKKIHRARGNANQKMPPAPKCWADIAEENMDPFFIQNDGGEFWYHTLEEDEDSEDGEFDLVLVSSTGAAALCRLKTWSVDGTFECLEVSVFFHQLWIIAVKTRVGSYAPVVYAMLRGKSQAHYKRVLRFLESNMEVEEPEQVKLDFERAEHLAFQEVYPGASLSGCDVHWKRALIRNIRTVGLGREVNQSLSLNLWFHKIWSMSLAPIEEIGNIWDYLVSIAPFKDTSDRDYDEEEIQAFNEYNKMLRKEREGERETLGRESERDLRERET